MAVIRQNDFGNFRVSRDRDIQDTEGILERQGDSSAARRA